MGCGHSKSDDAVSRVASAHVKKEFNKRRNSTKSTSSSSSSSSDDSKHVSKKGKKKKDIVVSQVIKANEDKIMNNESQKPLTPTPKSASSRGRKSSSSGFSEHEKDASSIDRNEVERKADDEDGEKGTAIFLIGGNDEEDMNAQKDTGTTHESVTDIKEDGGEDTQKANDDEMSQPGIIADGEEEEEEDDEDNIDSKSGNNENDNDTQQIKEQVDDEEDLGIYEDNGNHNDIDDENDKTPRSVGEDDFDDTEQQMNSDGEDAPDTFQEHNDANDTEHNKSTEPSHDIVNEDYDRSDDGDKILTLTPRSEREREAEENSLDVPDTFKMELNIGPLEMKITSS